MAHKILFLLIIVSAVGCNKPNPNPETLDPIYANIQSQVASVDAEITAEKAKLTENQTSFENVVPQTGQIKFAQKRIWESKNRIEKLNQLKKYWEVRKESRKIHARTEYMKAFASGKPWPDPNEYVMYKNQQKLENTSRSWNVKKRIQELSESKDTKSKSR